MDRNCCWFYQVCSNVDPRLTLINAYAISNLIPNAFEMEYIFENY